MPNETKPEIKPEAAAALDQQDIVALNEKLTADLSASQQLLDESNARNAALTAERDEAVQKLSTAAAALDASNANVTAITAERDKLAAENASLQTQMADFNKRLAAELSKHGIRREAIDQKPEHEGKKPTLTEQCRAAKAGK